MPEKNSTKSSENRGIDALENEWVEPRLSKEKIAELTKGIYKGNYFTSWYLDEPLLLLRVFLVLSLAEDEQISEWTEHPPVMICARMSDALPQSISGYPMFCTALFVYAQDAKLIHEKLKKLEAMEKEVMADME